MYGSWGACYHVSCKLLLDTTTILCQFYIILSIFVFSSSSPCSTCNVKARSIMKNILAINATNDSGFSITRPADFTRFAIFPRGFFDCWIWFRKDPYQAITKYEILTKCINSPKRTEASIGPAVTPPIKMFSATNTYRSKKASTDSAIIRSAISLLHEGTLTMKIYEPSHNHFVLDTVEQFGKQLFSCLGFSFKDWIDRRKVQYHKLLCISEGLIIRIKWIFWCAGPPWHDHQHLHQHHVDSMCICPYPYPEHVSFEASKTDHIPIQNSRTVYVSVQTWCFSSSSLALVVDTIVYKGMESFTHFATMPSERLVDVPRFLQCAFMSHTQWKEHLQKKAFGDIQQKKAFAARMLEKLIETA